MSASAGTLILVGTAIVIFCIVVAAAYVDYLRLKNGGGK